VADITEEPVAIPGQDAAALDVADTAPPEAPIVTEQQHQPKRIRARKERLKINREDIANRVIEFFTNDNADRAEDIEARLQRYAKFRMWTEGKDWPWENCSDATIPDMMTHSLRVQDTLHNAVMTSRPSIISRALKKADKEREQTVNELLDFQFFVENKGELIVGEAADAFVNDGVLTVFVPWIDEERETHEIMTLPALPSDQQPEMYFSNFLTIFYQGKIPRKMDKDGWSWQILDDPKDMDSWFPVEFYTVGKMIEMDAQKTVKVFEGPCPMVMDYEDILAPTRCANLQIPSPSNPNGAAHVVMVSYPTVDEIKRLVKSGFYDLVTDEELVKMGVAEQDEKTGQDEKVLKDVLQGGTNNLNTNEGAGEAKTPDHKRLTRLTCFDVFDIDGDGVNEDVIFWVIKETKTLLRVRELTQVYPCNPPRRPFAETSFIPVRGRRAGISLLEMMEGLHDITKQFADQTIDGGTITNVPFFFYRASSNMRPEVIGLNPGEGYPLSDPKNDVVFPQMPQQGSNFGFNLINLVQQWGEKLTNIGELQLGRVPQGKSSALRTARGMQSVMSQGDARPEHILRRFFIGLAEVFAQMHELNQVKLPREKEVRIVGVRKPDEDVYRKLDGPESIRGRFQFDFTANAMNTSKEALQESLNQFAAAIMNPLAIQMGVTQPDGVYALLKDIGKALGQDPDKYLTAPTPDSNLPKLFAEEVINLIMTGIMPSGRPAEPSQEHMKKLMEIANRDEFGYLTPPQVEMFKAWVTVVRQRMQSEAEQAARVQAAQQAQAGQQGDGVPGPQGTAPIDTSQAPLQKNELADESLPGAGGGGNQGPTLQ
jgi:hypothetical protein